MFLAVFLVLIYIDSSNPYNCCDVGSVINTILQHKETKAQKD